MSYFSNMNKDEIMELDRKLDQCAALAIKTYVNYTVRMDNEPSMDYYTNGSHSSTNSSLLFTADYLLSESETYQEAFQELYYKRFPKIKSDAVCKIGPNIYDEFTDMIFHISRERLICPELRIMLPIMFYTFVCNNAFNKAAQYKKRTRAKKKSSLAPHDEMDMKLKSVRLDSSNHCRKLCSIERKIAGDRKERKERFNRTSDDFIDVIEDMYQCYKEETHKHSMRAFFKNKNALSIALAISKYRSDIIYYEESALLGIFLSKLISSNTADTPLDRLLRLYIANRMDQLLIRTGALNTLPAYTFFDSPQPNALLRWYSESFNPPTNTEYITRMRKHLEAVAHNYEVLAQGRHNGNITPLLDYFCTLNHEEKYDPSEFATHYESLAQSFPLSNDDVNEIMNFYLDSKKLRKAVGISPDGSSSVSSTVSLRKGILEYIQLLGQVLAGLEPARKLKDFDTEMLVRIIRASSCERFSYRFYNFDRFFIASVIDNPRFLRREPPKEQES